MCYGLLIVLLAAVSWIFQPSYYSHDNWRRTVQYATPQPAYAPVYSYQRRTYHWEHAWTGNGDHRYTFETWKMP